MLRYRAAERKRDGVDFRAEQLTKTDRNGKLARVAPGLVNWAGDTENKLTRPLMERVAGVHREAELPQFHGQTFPLRAQQNPPTAIGRAPCREKVGPYV